MNKIVGFVGIAALTLSACGPELIVDLDGRGSMKQRIFYGSAPAAAEHEAVVALHEQDRRYVYGTFCTGTLIAPDVVLTAAHCLNTSKKRTGVRSMDPSKLLVYFGDGPLSPSEVATNLFDVAETSIHPAYNPAQLRNDIALVRLAAPYTGVAPVAALPPADGFTAADIGINLNFAGFGVTETGDSGVKLQADNALDGLGCNVAGCPDSGDAATMISYDQSAGPCSGDSGGPAFIDRGGVPYVGGVTSYGDSGCTIYGVSTRADAFVDSYIEPFINGGGTEPPPPPPPPTEGCGDGVCSAGESCDGRSGTLSCKDDCRGKTKGKPSSQYCYVEGVCEGPGC